MQTCENDDTGREPMGSMHLRDEKFMKEYERHTGSESKRLDASEGQEVERKTA